MLPKKLAVIAAFSAAVAWCGPAAHADVVTSNASGFGLDTSLSLLLLNLNLAPQAYAGGSAPDAFSVSNAVLSLDANVIGLARIQAGILQGEADSNVNGFYGSRLTSSSGSVTNLSASVLLGSVLNLQATTIRSDSMIHGDFGSLSAMGTSTLADVSLSVLGVTLDVDANAAANTVLFDALGVRVILNEQLMSGDGINSAGIEMNAIRISFTNVVAGLGLLNGDIRLGHSSASMNAVVPAPSTAMLVLPAGLLLARRRR